LQNAGFVESPFYIFERGNVMKEQLAEFRALVEKQAGDTRILDREEDRLIYAHGVCPYEYKWILQGRYPCLPSLVLLPASAQEVSEIVKAAACFEIGIIPFGGGSGSVAGTSPENGQVIVDLKRFQHFSINEKNCTAAGGAGIIGADFEDLLNRAGYTAGHYPQSYQSAVLGGMVATRAIGTFSTKYGKMDDIVNSLEVVLPDGQILRTHKAPKRSTGPELNELFLGSEGAYGIITEVELKIHPLPERRYFEAYTFPETLQGLEAIRIFIQKGVLPPVIRLYDHEESQGRIAKYGYEKGYSILIVGYEGMTEEVEWQRHAVERVCLENHGAAKGTRAGDEWMAGRFSTKKIQDYHAIRGGTADAIEVAAPWDAIGKVWREMRRVLEPLSTSVECHFSHVYHSGASVYVIFHCETGGDDVEGEKRYRQCAALAVETSLANGGNISHHHGVGRLKAEYMTREHGEAGLDVMKKIKTVLDPKGIFNRGVLGL
jgi:alkyldihydroxyacetonephosphate synthase